VCVCVCVCDFVCFEFRPCLLHLIVGLQVAENGAAPAPDAPVAGARETNAAQAIFGDSSGGSDASDSDGEAPVGL
jgi:hypothetical protein